MDDRKLTTNNNIVDEASSVAYGADVYIRGVRNSGVDKHVVDSVNPSPWIFLTGGSGYIGSHVAAHIKSTIPDRLLTIDRRAKSMSHTTKYCDMFADEDFVSPITLQSIRDFSPTTVIHLAASSTIEPGMKDPISYWDNNVIKTLQLLDNCVKNNVKNFIFASTSSVYADSDEAVSETSLCNPTNAYGRTKYTIEQVLKDYNHAYGLNSIIFRFFNAAGSHQLYELGELNGSSHLIAKIMESMVHKTPFTIYGRDYDTVDGTGLRDYTHVMDIVDAISTSLDWLPNNPGCYIMNLGAGHGYTVQQVVDKAEKLFDLELSYRYGPRRDGDTSKRFANISKANNMLGWSPKRNMDDILKDSYKWYKSNTYNSLTTNGIRAYL